MTSLFFLHVKETGVWPLMTLQGIDKWAPTSDFGINKGAITGLSGFGT